MCGCPPGGATEETALANGCAAPAEGDYAEALQATLRLGVGPIRECYSRYLEQGRGVQGRVLTAFDVNPWGELENVRLDESSLPSPDVQRCVLRVVRELEVPPPPGGQTLPVSYPFTFTTD